MYLDLSECQTVKGARGYVGTQSTTKHGHTCQRWDRQEPQNHLQDAKSNDAAYFPDNTLAEASNYCRNPTGDTDLWCYITDTDAGYKWEYCDVPVCGRHMFLYASLLGLHEIYYLKYMK